MALTRIKEDNLSTAVLDKIRELSIDSSTALNLFSVTDNGGDGSLTVADTLRHEWHEYRSKCN